MKGFFAMIKRFFSFDYTGFYHDSYTDAFKYWIKHRF